MRVLVKTQVVTIDAEVGVPSNTLVDPVLVPFLIGSGLNKELQFHLLKLAGAENEVPGRDLIAERLADLGNPKRRLLTRRSHDIVEVDKDSLRGFRSQVVQALFIVDGTKIGLEEAGKRPRLRPLTPHATVRACDLSHRHFVLVHTLLLCELLDQLVLTEAVVT